MSLGIFGSGGGFDIRVIALFILVLVAFVISEEVTSIL
jgi:hypothetical protein